MDKVVVYPGRFQPMLKHHAEVYRRLVNEYPDAEVYIGTSDKVEPGKSPFNFAEKQKIAQAHGIDPSRVLQVKNPYHMDSYPFDKDNTQVIFAVGEKDAEQRFPANSVKKDGTPGYYQRLGSDDEPQPMSKRGYITVAPNVTDGGDVASASAFRQAMQGARSPEEAKQIYVKQFGSYDPNVFKMIYNKVADKTMEQLDLNHMRKLAGLSENSFDQEEEAIQKELSSYAEKHALRGKDLEKYIGKTITLWQEGSTNPPFDRKFEIHPGKNGKGVWVVLAGDPKESGDNYEPEDFVISNAAGDYSWPSQEVANSYNDMYNDKYRDLNDRYGEMSEGPEDRLKSNYYGMSDQQRQLADMGRALMNSQFKYDDALGNKMADVGNELTKFGTPEGSKSMEDMLRKLKMSKDELLKFMKKGKELVDQGAHEMGRDMDSAPDDDSDLEDDGSIPPVDPDYDYKDSTLQRGDTAKVIGDMEPEDDDEDPDVAAADDELGETSLDLNDIRGDYGIAEDSESCPDCSGEGLTPGKPDVGEVQTYCKTCGGTKRKPDAVSYSMVQVDEDPGVSMSNQGAENVTGSEDPHSKNDKHQIPYPYPSDDVDQVNTNVKKYQRPTWEVEPGDRVPNGEVDEQANEFTEFNPKHWSAEMASAIEDILRRNDGEASVSIKDALSELMKVDANEVKKNMKFLTNLFRSYDLEYDLDEGWDTPGAQAWPEAEPEGAMGGATSYAGTDSYAGDEVSVSELNQMRVAAGLEPVIDEVQVGDGTAGITGGDPECDPDNRYPGKPAVNPYGDDDPLDGEHTGTGGAGKPQKHYYPPHDPMYEEDEDCPTYEDQVVELMRLAGIDCDNVYVSEEPRYEREVQPYKGDNAGFGMVDRYNDEELDPIVNEGMTDADIAQKVKDKGASLEDEKDFIKHLYQVSKELKLGRYVMDNPDFIPDVMSAFRELDESSWGCTSCGQNPCVGGPACGAMGTDEPGPNNPFPADPKNGGYHRPSPCGEYEEVDEGAGCPCCSGPCGCESDCPTCGGCSMEEAIGDGFLSGNQAIGRVLRQMLELEEMVEAYQERLGMTEDMDERYLTPAQRKADQMGTAILRAKNRIASRTGRSGGKTTVVTDPISAGDFKAYGKKKHKKGVKVVSDPYAAHREESVQEDAIEATMEELRTLAGL